MLGFLAYYLLVGADGSKLMKKIGYHENHHFRIQSRFSNSRKDKFNKIRVIGQFSLWVIPDFLFCRLAIRRLNDSGRKVDKFTKEKLTEIIRSETRREGIELYFKRIKTERRIWKKVVYIQRLRTVYTQKDLFWNLKIKSKHSYFPVKFWSNERTNFGVLEIPKYTLICDLHNKGSLCQFSEMRGFHSFSHLFHLLLHQAGFLRY